MYKSLFSLLLVVVVEVISAVVTCLKDHLTRHMYADGRDGFDDDQAFV
ncbi:hypothetical protein [Cupriavidus campinensis]|uniref:Uncharacterized protein n=1 Tax=Cupriavidus campinensis TaxID=151783 RepID=A0AAE9I1W2_9BURK|nr:hypothetical protein [Cupriavidus campinensis]URF05048.1 hypothetical protein M5D45_04205 [Cupriavidus campinensis]